MHNKIYLIKLKYVLLWVVRFTFSLGTLKLEGV